MNHIYFTALKDGAGFAAQIAAGKAEVPHVYLVEPTGPYENDPNVTDKNSRVIPHVPIALLHH